MSDKSGMEMIADCHGVTEENLITALGFCSMTSSIESLEHLERAHGLVTSLSYVPSYVILRHGYATRPFGT